MADQLELPTKELDYDEWLEFFRKQETGKLYVYERQMIKKLPPDGSAALRRWIEIIDNPSKMDKLYQGRLKTKNDKNIMDIAVGDDDEEFYEALIRENVQQLNTSNISQQEVARLTQNINIFRKELREIRSRKPKKGTVLEKVLKKAEMPPCPNGLGSRPLNGQVAGHSQPCDDAGSNPVGGAKKKPKTRLTVDNRGKNKASKTRSKAKLESETGKVSSKKEENGD